MNTTYVMRLGLVCALAATSLAVGPATAQEGVAIKNILGDVGIIPKERDPIRYRERAPLVLPPRMELREPAAPESFASNNPQWPKDPDVVSRQRRAAESRVPATDSEVRRMSERNARLTVDEMRAGRNPNATGPAPGSHRGDNARDVLMRNAPPEGYVGEKTADSSLVRRTLTDPPTMLKKNSGAPEAVDYRNRGDQQRFDANPLNWILGRTNEDD
jgi:hypothetical protein